MITTFDLQAEGLWKIESTEFQKGGDIEWYKPYRLRHIISEKFLGVKEGMGDNMKFELSDKKDEWQLFQFIKIENLMSKYESKTKIHKDAYFRMEHLKTGWRLGFEENLNAESAKEDEEVSKQHKNSLY